jgi:adenylate cyclase
VDIDEKSIAQFGQWPWPRDLMALLLLRIKNMGASSVGIDVLYSETDRMKPILEDEGILSELSLTLEEKRFLQSPKTTDIKLAEVLSHGPFTLGYEFLFDQENLLNKNCILNPTRMVFLTKGDSTKDSKPFFEATDMVCNLSLLTEAATSTGFFNITTDQDGILRRAPLVIEYDGQFYPSLPLATLMRAWNVDQLTAKITDTVPNPYA